MEMLTVSHVYKRFGDRQVLDNLSFSVPEGSVYGFIGKNGAGKTTTMKTILGLIAADSGEITVNGASVSFGENRTNRYIGYLPDVPEFYYYMTPAEYLTFCGEITGMRQERIKSRTAELLELVGLAQEKKRIRGFSRGMKQRLGIAQALLNQPKLLICDEPTSALDPIGRKEILDILIASKEQTTVLFSTHVLSDVERICDNVAFLQNGKIAQSGTIEQIKQMHPEAGFAVEFQQPKDCEQLLQQFSGGRKVSDRHLIYEGKGEAGMSAILQYVVANDLPIQKIERLEPTLESMFLEVVNQ